MSTFNKETKNPKTGEWENATWHDDLLGRHHYGVLFPSDEAAIEDLRGSKRWGVEAVKIAYDPDKIELETRVHVPSFEEEFIHKGNLREKIEVIRKNMLATLDHPDREEGAEMALDAVLDVLSI